MPRSKPIEPKTIYELWWKYLKRSTRYREFCETIQQAEEEIAVTESTTTDKGKALSGRDLYRLKKITELSRDARIFDRVEELYRDKWKEKHESVEGRDYSDPWELLDSWEFFGDVHEDEDGFEKWWSENGSRLRDDFMIDLSDPEAVQALPLLEASLRRFRKLKDNRCPTSKEILELITSDNEYVFVAVPLRKLTGKQVGKELNSIRKERRQFLETKGAYRSRSSASINRIHEDELARYLEAYDQFIREPNASGNRKKPSPDVKRAEKIIKNVERFTFPGPYQPGDFEV